MFSQNFQDHDTTHWMSSRSLDFSVHETEGMESLQTKEAWHELHDRILHKTIDGTYNSQVVCWKTDQASRNWAFASIMLKSYYLSSRAFESHCAVSNNLRMVKGKGGYARKQGLSLVPE